jgi:hypothetical protein
VRGPSTAAVTRVAQVRVYRQRAGSAGLRRWQLELDGAVVGSIENGGTSVLEAGPGPHSLRVFYDRYSSLPLDVELRAGQELVLGCRQQPNPLLSVYSPRRSLVLELLAGRPRGA